MRKNADELLTLAARKKEPIGILKNNKLKAYLIDAETLEALERFVEDYLDSKMVEERLIKAKKSDFIKSDEFLKNLDVK
ncbi:MAG: RelB [Candidatus Woesebacteria bacterium GW2011_GWA1_39_8]|nr:MAG: RelB [Candidatus Woesebacteria bacterium GW2011_GWA1_39_8]